MKHQTCEPDASGPIKDAPPPDPVIDAARQGDELAQLALRESMYRSMFEHSVEGIYQSTPDGTYLHVNPALARMYGYENPAELLKQVKDIRGQIYVDPGMRERFETELVQNDVVRGLEYQVRRRNGQTIWISENARVVRDESGRVRYYEGFIQEITQRKAAEAALRASQQELIETSRQIGMAEVATGLLHNMGNAFNSINVSATVLGDRLRHSKVASVAKAAAMLQGHQSDLRRFLATDPKGRQLPQYLVQLGQHLLNEQAEAQEELARLRKSLEHVSAILAVQQSYAKASSMAEKVNPKELVEDALRMSAGATPRKDIELVRQYAAVLPEVIVSKHSILQILVNLIHNAQKACGASEQFPKRIVIRIHPSENNGLIRIEVTDNGVGISTANLTRIFNHGFTTRKDGHGFGLHSGALLARELGGALTAHSDGPGKGACFRLEFPCIPPPGNQSSSAV